MGIGKSRITPSINIDDMLEKAEISHEIEAEKQDADKRLAEVLKTVDIRSPKTVISVHFSYSLPMAMQIY